MYQLNAVPGRTFAALRVGVEHGMEDILEDNFDVYSEFSRGTRLSPDEMIISVLDGIFSPFSPCQRADALVALSRRWGLRVPGRGDKSYEDYCSSIIKCLSLRVSPVVARRSGAPMEGSSRVMASSASVRFSCDASPRRLSARSLLSQGVGSLNYDLPPTVVASSRVNTSAVPLPEQLGGSCEGSSDVHLSSL
ncbi:adenylyl cyclase [Trypanosoma grayi]|uniref:adenylyl cyclase n=1 Tax=Trypanosoma grayi TaxID=71804 RepID=UPI0004F40CA2|nr:adenylyl cyclase [Trypanosoma grayi]KEG05599.1 adenylyl cyclase [Trypanosoma grayi]